MRLLFCGDVVGRAGRDAVMRHLPALKLSHAIDFVILSGDNAAGGFGISPQLCHEFYQIGVNVITGGDHIWDQKEAHSFLEREKRLLRPHNFPPKAPGRGFGIYTLPNGDTIAVLHLLGQVFHKEHLNCPFACADEALKDLTLNTNVAAVFVDMHCEATSEKNAMGVYLDGRVSAVIGSHTHIPTADARILPKGTAYHTDAGMCGDYNSIIGFDTKAPLHLFTTKMKKTRMQPATGEGTLCATLIDVATNGLAKNIEHIRLGGTLNQPISVTV